jgi:hypothetical protein
MVPTCKLHQKKKEKKTLFLVPKEKRRERLKLVISAL